MRARWRCSTIEHQRRSHAGRPARRIARPSARPCDRRRCAGGDPQSPIWWCPRRSGGSPTCCGTGISPVGRRPLHRRFRPTTWCGFFRGRHIDCRGEPITATAGGVARPRWPRSATAHHRCRSGARDRPRRHAGCASTAILGQRSTAGRRARCGPGDNAGDWIEGQCGHHANEIALLLVHEVKFPASATTGAI